MRNFRYPLIILAILSIIAFAYFNASVRTSDGRNVRADSFELPSLNSFFSVVDQGKLRNEFDEVLAGKAVRSGDIYKRSKIFQWKQGVSFSPDQSYRFLRFKLFDDVDLVLSGDSLEKLGENRFFYSAEINGGEGRLRLSYFNGHAIGSIDHLGKFYEIKMYGDGNLYVTEVEREPFECDESSNDNHQQTEEAPLEKSVNESRLSPNRKNSGRVSRSISRRENKKSAGNIQPVVTANNLVMVPSTISSSSTLLNSSGSKKLIANLNEDFKGETLVSLFEEVPSSIPNNLYNFSDQGENKLRILILYTEEAKEELILDAPSSSLNETNTGIEIQNKLNNHSLSLVNSANDTLINSGVSIRLELVEVESFPAIAQGYILGSDGLKGLTEELEEEGSYYNSLMEKLKCDRPGCYFDNKYGVVINDDPNDGEKAKINFGLYWWPTRANYYLEKSMSVGNNQSLSVQFGSEIRDLREETKADVVVLITGDFDYYPANLQTDGAGNYISCDPSNHTCDKLCLRSGVEGGWYYDNDEEVKFVEPGQGMCHSGRSRMNGRALGVSTGKEKDVRTSVFSMEFSSGEQTFIHELGHVLGLSHNIEAECEYNLESCNKNDAAYRGEVNTNVMTATIMSYANTCRRMGLSDEKCEWIKIFSNPFYMHKGSPMGGNLGTENPSFTACALEMMKGHFTNFYEYWSGEKEFVEIQRTTVCDDEHSEVIQANMTNLCNGETISGSDMLENNINKLMSFDGCTIIEGDLIIEGQVASAFSSLNNLGLNPFRELKSISGKLSIIDTNLNGLNYFENLEETGSVEMEGNDQLNVPTEVDSLIHFP